MRVDGKFRFDPREVPGCVLRTGVVRRNHAGGFGTFLQKFGAGHTYFMQYNIRALSMFDEVLVRSHVPGNHHRMALVVNAEPERVLNIGMLHIERGNSHRVPVVDDSFHKVFGYDGYLLRGKSWAELTPNSYVSLVSLFQMRHHLRRAFR